MSEPNLQAILSELRDSNKDKRRTAVMKLGMLGGEDAIRAYEDLIVRGRAAMMLGKIGNKSAVAPLIRALEAPGYQTPLFAAEALGRLGDIRAIAPLLQVAENSRDRLQETAFEALARLGYSQENKPESQKLEAEPI
jgi:HEAT repeat protein